MILFFLNAEKRNVKIYPFLMSTLNAENLRFVLIIYLCYIFHGIFLDLFNLLHLSLLLLLHSHTLALCLSYSIRVPHILQIALLVQVFSFFDIAYIIENILEMFSKISRGR